MRFSDALRKIGQPIAYYRDLARPLGGATCSILFSQIFYWQDKSENPLGVYKTQEELQNETGLTRTELENARKKLRNLGILIETNKRLEHKIYYCLDLNKLDELMAEYTCIGEEVKPATPNAENPSPRMRETCIGEEVKPAFVIDQENTTLDYNTRLHTNNTPLPPKEKNQKFVAENVDLPEWVNREDWISFCEMRSNLKKTLTPKACVIALSKLEKLKSQGEDISAVIEQSVFNNWQGLFAVHDSVKDKSSDSVDIDCQAVIEAFNTEFDGRYAKVELNRTTEKIIRNLVPHLRNKTLGAFVGYFESFNETAGEYYNRFGFSFVMKPETLQKLREGAL